MDSRIKKENGRIIISIKPFGALEKVERALGVLKDDRLKEINVSLTMDDLYWIRRTLANDLCENELSRENMVDSIKYRKSLEESE